MSRRTLVSLLMFAAVAGGACGDDDDPSGPQAELFTAGPLSGANERPNPVTSPAGGTASFSYRNGVLTYTLSVTGMTPTAAHIHGPANSNTAAGVIVGLNVGSNQTIASTGHATINMDSLLVLMRNGNSYVNVHSTAFPGGEIRAQIQRQ